MKSTTFGRRGCWVLLQAFVTSAPEVRPGAATSAVRVDGVGSEVALFVGGEFLSESVICFRAFANPNFVTRIERYASYAPMLPFQAASRKAKIIGIHTVKCVFGHVKRCVVAPYVVLIRKCGG